MNKLLVLIPMLGLLLSGCETTEGFGRDLKKAGSAIENSASKKNNENSQPPESEHTHYYDR